MHDKKNTEIRENREQLGKVWNKAFDVISDLVFIQNKDYTIIRANKAFSDALKSKPEDIVGKKCYRVLHKSDKPWPECPLEKTRRDMKAHSQEVDDPNTGIPFLVTSLPIFDADGKFMGSVHIAKDITEQKKAERVLKDARAKLEENEWGLRKTNDAVKVLYKELEKKNKQLQKLDQLKSDFISTVSHELRTPLSITKEGINLVLDKIPGNINEKQEKILLAARNNINRLALIINDLLDMSKIEAGKIELRRVLVNISSLVEEICAEWKPESHKKHQTFKVSTPGAPVDIYVDPDKITQVLNNLISNSIKYTQEKGSIKVGLKDREKEVEVFVSDNGSGIAREDLPRVFTKFQQFHRLAGPGVKGTGLGLVIVKQLVEMHRGSITVESDIDKGSRFTFSLPKLDVDSVFKEYIDNGIKEATGREAPLSLIIIHISKFDQLRKKQGYETAHNLLKDIEKVTRDSLRRRADSVVRDTGDLMVLLFNTAKENIAVVRSRIEKAISDYLSGSKEKWLREVRISFGSATHPDETQSNEDLMDMARQNLEIQKMQGS